MPKSSRVVSRRRILVMLLGYFLLSVFLIGRLAYWQFVKNEWLEAKAEPQWNLTVPVAAKRGTIYDREMRPLAISVDADTVAAVPAQIVNPEETARKLSSVLEVPYEDLLGRLQKKSYLVYLKRRVEPEVAEEVKKLNLPGIYFRKEGKRYYPNDSLACHVLGIAGIDEGLEGLERVYEEYLRGKEGAIEFDVDAQNQGRRNREVVYKKPEDGNDIVLTLDMTIQAIIETRLEKALALHNAERVIAIVMDPHTGAVLALANKPDYDPNNFQNVHPSAYRNYAIEAAFEPGSTFKIVTMAAALEEQVVNLEERFFDPGYITVAGARIHCWKYGGHGSQTYREVIQHSCNPGFVSLGLRLGKERLFHYIEKFGFGRKTGIDLPGEGKGIMFSEEQIGPVELATTSFGQGPAVTPIQQVTAVAAIANGGILPTPHVVAKIVDKDGKLVKEGQPPPRGRVISEETARIMRELLESVVSEGTGSRAAVPGYRVAGKTGTAQVPNPKGGYYANKYIASFIGFAPANDPQVVMYVAVVDPKGPYGYYGGTVAAPLYGEIMQEILHYLGVEKQETVVSEAGEKVLVPNVVGQPLAVAQAQLRARGLQPQSEGPTAGSVREQTPAAGTEVPIGSRVVLRTEKISNELPETAIVPDVTGLSVREASNILGLAGLRIKIVGSGVAVAQDVKPGSQVSRNSVVTVEFHDPSP